jgi:hypothetical protein
MLTRLKRPGPPRDSAGNYFWLRNFFQRYEYFIQIDCIQFDIFLSLTFLYVESGLFEDLIDRKLYTMIKILSNNTMPEY